MERYYLTVPALLAVGFAYGELRNRARVAKPMPVWVMVVWLLGICFVGLLLAGVTGSTTLGWLAGLSLMLLLPVVVLGWIGYLIGSLFNRSKSVAASPPIGHAAPAALRGAQPAGTTTMMTVIVDRDSVAAGDDTDSHAVTATVPVASNVSELVAAALQVCPLASISGDWATWLYVVAEHLSVSSLFTGSGNHVRLRYWNQADPDAVLAALRDGRPLPPRY